MIKSSDIKNATLTHFANMFTVCPFTFKVMLLQTESESKKNVMVKQKIDTLNIYLTLTTRKVDHSSSVITLDSMWYI